MPGFPDGTPCWADAVLPDLDAGKRFYGELLGWEFRGGDARYGNYTQAYRGDANVAALAPLPAGGMEPAWNLYFAAADVKAAAARITAAGGTLLMEPMAIGEYGSMLMAQDPGGAVFGLWQAGEHRGFQATGSAGSFCWAEVLTREPQAVDDFYSAVLGVTTQQIGDGTQFDYTVWYPNGEPGKHFMGRLRLDDDETPPHLRVYFAVDDADAAASTTVRLGGTVLDGPHDSPFGRTVSLRDPAGARFVAIDTSRRVGEEPKL